MIRHTLSAGLFAATGFLAAPTAHADAAGEALVREALNAISSQAGWTATSDRIRSDGDLVIVEGLSIGNGEKSIQLTVDTVSLADFAKHGDGYFASGTAVRNLSVSYDLSSLMPIDTADNVSTSMASTVRIETMEIADLFLPAAGPSDAGQTGLLSGIVGLYSYLAKVEMASMSAPRMELEQSIALPDLDKNQTSRTIYHDVRVTDWSGGIIARYDLGRLEIKMSGGPEGDYDMGAESAFAEHIDIDHAAHVLDPARYANGRGDGVWKPLMKRAEYLGFRVNTRDVNVNVRRIGLNGFDARQSETPLLSQIEALIASGLSGKEPSEEEALEMVSEMFPNIFGFFRLGEFTLEGLKVVPVVSSKKGTASIDRIRVAGFSGDGINHFSFDGVSVSGPDETNVSLGTFGFDGLRFPDWEILMDFAKAAEQGKDLEKNPELLAKMLDLYPSIDTFIMRDLVGNAPGKEPFGIEEISFEVTGRMGTFMASGKGAVRGFVFPASYFDQGGGPNPLTMLNYDRLAADFVFESVWDEATSELDYTANMMFEDAGDLALGYGLSGITEATIRRIFADIIALEASGGGDDPARVIAVFQNFGFKGFSFSFTDRSIVDRALTFAASMQGSDAQTYRGQLKGALPFFMGSMPPGNFRQQATDAALAALDGGQKTTFSLTPQRTLMVPEIAAAAMQDPLSLIELLGAGMSSEPAN